MEFYVLLGHTAEGETEILGIFESMELAREAKNVERQNSVKYLFFRIVSRQLNSIQAASLRYNT